MAVERLLLETGDVLLLETGDDLLLESSTAGADPGITGDLRDDAWDIGELAALVQLDNFPFGGYFPGTTTITIGMPGAGNPSITGDIRDDAWDPGEWPETPLIELDNLPFDGFFPGTTTIVVEQPDDGGGHLIYIPTWRRRRR